METPDFDNTIVIWKSQWKKITRKSGQSKFQKLFKTIFFKAILRWLFRSQSSLLDQVIKKACPEILAKIIFVTFL